MAHAHVIGLGRSGIAAARVLNHHGWQVSLSDRNANAALQRQQQALAQEGITVRLGETLSLQHQPSPDRIVVSPGVPWDSPVLVEARQRGIETVGEMELAWRYRRCDRWVGITGTNGKTTTTALAAAIFQAAGLHAPACGNIGYAACELALPPERPDWVVAEISSYQIESSCQLAPQIGIWTTFSADHLERHGTLERYYAIKASLLRRCSHQVLNGDDPHLRWLGPEQWPQAYWTSIAGRSQLPGDPARGVWVDGDWVVAFGEPVVSLDAFAMVGAHNRQNLLLAVAAARLAGIASTTIAEGVARFPGVPHRLERVGRCNGVEFINDSKATNYDAAQVGLAAVAAPAIVIAGGEPKSGDDAAWLDAICAKAAAVLLIGEAAPQLAGRLQQWGYRHAEMAETLERAVERSEVLARQKQARTVLLSPACASFDQFRDFEQRGDRFRTLCQQLMDATRHPQA